MKKTLLTTLLASAALVSTVAIAEGWRFLPVLSDKSMKFEPSVALSVNYVDPDAQNLNSTTALGVDFNFNCGLIQDPNNRIRTHINLTSSDEDRVEVLGFELSPRYTVPLGNGLSIGAGPSIAVYQLDLPGISESLLGLGVAAGVNYRKDAFYAGADLRVHNTRTERGLDYDNVMLGAKVGLNF